MKKIALLLIFGLAICLSGMKAEELTKDVYVLNHYEITKFLEDNGYNIIDTWKKGKSFNAFRSAVTKRNIKKRKRSIKIDWSKLNRIADVLDILGFQSYPEEDEILQSLKSNELLFLCGAEKCGFFKKENRRSLSSWVGKLKEGYKLLKKKNPELFKVFEFLINAALKINAVPERVKVSYTTNSQLDIDDLCQKIISVIATQAQASYMHRSFTVEDLKLHLPMFHVIVQKVKDGFELISFPQIPQDFYDKIISFKVSSSLGKKLLCGGAGLLLLGGGAYLARNYLRVERPCKEGVCEDTSLTQICSSMSNGYLKQGCYGLEKIVYKQVEKPAEPVFNCSSLTGDLKDMCESAKNNYYKEQNNLKAGKGLAEGAAKILKGLRKVEQLRAHLKIEKNNFKTKQDFINKKDITLANKQTELNKLQKQYSDNVAQLKKDIKKYQNDLVSLNSRLANVKDREDDILASARKVFGNEVKEVKGLVTSLLQEVDTLAGHDKCDKKKTDLLSKFKCKTQELREKLEQLKEVEVKLDFNNKNKIVKK